MEVWAPGELVDLEATLLDRIHKGRFRVPPYPAVLAKLQKVAGNERSGAHLVAPIISADASLAAIVIARASSAANRGANAAPISLDAAVIKLGLDEVMRLAFATSVGSAMLAPGALSELRRDEWRRSLIAGRLCQELAPRRKLDPGQAFVAGLLHDIGSVAVINCLEDIAHEKRLPPRPAYAWRAIIDKFHIEVGAMIAERWKLPEPIVEVITHHHRAEAGKRPLVDLVAMVDHVIAILDRSPGTGIAALIECPGLESTERIQVGLLVPQIAHTMLDFESLMPAARPADPPSKVITPGPTADDGWPIDCAVMMKQGEARADRIWSDTFRFLSPRELQPAWLAQLTLHCEPTPIEMFATVKTCEAAGAAFRVVAAPFALDGKDKQAWLATLARCRRS